MIKSASIRFDTIRFDPALAASEWSVAVVGRFAYAKVRLADDGGDGVEGHLGREDALEEADDIDVAERRPRDHQRQRPLEQQQGVVAVLLVPDTIGTTSQSIIHPFVRSFMSMSMLGIDQCRSYLVPTLEQRLDDGRQGALDEQVDTNELLGLFIEAWRLGRQTLQRILLGHLDVRDAILQGIVV